MSFTPLATAAPADDAGAAAVGTGTTAARADHVHRAAGLIGTTQTIAANANYTVLATDRIVNVTGTTAGTPARTITLPQLSLQAQEVTLLDVFDGDGSCSVTNQIQISRSGTDLIRGTTTRQLTSSRAGLSLVGVKSLGYWWYTSSGTIV